jgi:hypothetical protein
MRNSIVILEFLALLSQTGCSLAFVRGPSPSRDPSTTARPGVRTECTSSNVLPVLDTIAGVPLVFLSLAGLAVASNEKNAHIQAGDVLGVLSVTAVGALLVASGVIGAQRTADCRRSIDSTPREVPKLPTGSEPSSSVPHG